MMWLVFLVSFGSFDGYWIDGLGLVLGLCRDAGMSRSNVPWLLLLTRVTGLWSTQQGNKPNKRSRRSATRTSWVDLSMFERYDTCDRSHRCFIYRVF